MAWLRWYESIRFLNYPLNIFAIVGKEQVAFLKQVINTLDIAN